MAASPSRPLGAQRLFVLAAVVLSLATGLAAQTSTAAPGLTVPYTSVKSRIAPIPPQLTLSSSNGGPGGEVWLREIDSGIVVQMRIHTLINSGPGQWASTPLEMNSRPYVAVWLASTARVSMPPIGWGNQFGMMNCTTYRLDSRNPPPVNCAAWSRLQQQYRMQLRRLFIRKWVLTPELSRETYASQAYRNVLLYSTDADAGDFARLRPRGALRLDRDDQFFQWTKDGPASTAYSYSNPAIASKTTIQEFQIPWNIFPPADELALSHFRINVLFCAKRGVCSSTAPLGRPNNPATWNRLRLGRPHVTQITPCQYDLQVEDAVGDAYPAWYFPVRGADVTSVFGLGNLVQGYQYDPGGLSPILIPKTFFDRSIAPGQTLCGPQLSWQSSGTRYRSKYTIDPDALAFHRMPGGITLIRSGPTRGSANALGTGAGGANPVDGFAFYALLPDQGIKLLIQKGFDLGFQSGAIQLSPDWKSLTVYQNGPDLEEQMQSYTKGWLYKRYCWGGNRYRMCGTGAGAPPAGVPILMNNWNGNSP